MIFDLWVLAVVLLVWYLFDLCCSLYGYRCCALGFGGFVILLSLEFLILWVCLYLVDFGFEVWGFTRILVVCFSVCFVSWVGFCCCRLLGVCCLSGLLLVGCINRGATCWVWICGY